MNKIFLIIVLNSILGIESCKNGLNIDKVIPDVTTVLSKSFLIRIYYNSGSSNDEILDISASPDFNSFKNIVKGYKLDKITYQLKNDNVPEDMYFSGEVVCKNFDGSQTFSVGNIARVKISEGAKLTTESDVVEKITNMDIVMGWLQNPGSFKLASSYTLTDAKSTPYQISSNIAGSNFEIIVRFYLTVKTGI